jgi:predicted PurR-regulated permease PerM
MEFYLSVLLGILFGFICSYLAKNRGRNPRTWFILGLLFGLIGLIILLVLPSNKTLNNHVQSDTNRFQREKLTQTTIQENTQPYPDINSPPSTEEMYQMNTWYYLDKAHNQVGPVNFNILIQEFQKEEITLDSYVWFEGMANWQKIHQVQGLLELLDEKSL